MEVVSPSLKRSLSQLGFVRRTRQRTARRGPFRRGRRRRTFRRFAGSDIEMKVHDVTIDDAVISALGTIQAELLEIPEGVGEEQRVGRKITVKKLIYRYQITIPTTTTAANTSDTVRIRIVHDKQCNGALPAVTDVMATDFFLGLNNLNNVNRFRTLYDKFHDISCPSGAGNGTTDRFGEGAVTAEVFINMDIPIEYDNSAATGDIATIRSNNIFALFQSKAGLCALVGRMRIRYTDR